jgi:hypothetical protein
MWLPLYRPKVGISLFVVSFPADLLLHANAFLFASVFVLVLLWAIYGKGRPPAPVVEQPEQGGHLIPHEWAVEVMEHVTQPRAILTMLPEPPPPTLGQRARRRARLARWAVGRAFWRVGVALAPHLRYEGED